MKQIVKVAAFTLCVVFLCVFGVQTAHANSTEVIKKATLKMRSQIGRDSTVRN